jgi:uncharacterized cupredoxin-like copper-binding protein
VTARQALLGALLAGALATGAGCAVVAADSDAGAAPARVPGPGLVTIRVDIRYSRFHLSAARVRRGSVVRFVVDVRDPIDHEFLVGDARVHRLHEHGTERTHPPVPGEVSVGAGTVGETFSRFDHVGRVLYACHLPGHYAYGMVGEITVVP